MSVEFRKPIFFTDLRSSSMRMQLLRAGMITALIGMGHAASAADGIAMHFGSVTLVGTLYTDATRHIYLRLDQPITVTPDPASSREPALVNQLEVDVAAIVTDRPINGVHVSLTGELEHGSHDSRPLMLAVQSTQYLQ